MMRALPSRGTPQEDGRRRARASSWVILLAGGLACGRLHAWTAEDSAFGSFLVTQLRYHDTAARWLDGLEKRGGLGDEDRAEISVLRIDLLLAQGKEKEAAAALESFKKAYPSHPRASRGSLDFISREMGKVLALLDAARLQTDPKKAAESQAQAAKLFASNVEKPLDALIADLQAKVQQLQAQKREAEKKASPKEKGKASPRKESTELDDLILNRDQAELSRIKAYLVYGRRLDPKAPERKTILEKGLKLAEVFIDQRYEFFVMQYEGQLQRGFFEYELGRYASAEDTLSVLYDIEPPGGGTPSKPLIDAFKNLRLQALLFGARSAIGGGNTARGVEIIETNFLGGKKGPFDLSTAEEDPNLRQFAVLLRLEYAVALAGVGRIEQGLDLIQQLIARYSQPGEGARAAEFLTEARRALGRMAALPGVRLRGQDYYQAAMGLKSELKWEAALDAFQMALQSVVPKTPQDRKVQVLCLNEIGECSFVLQRFAESALAYQEVYRYLMDADEEILPKVAQNFLAAANKAAEAAGEASGAYVKLRDDAGKFSDEKGTGLGPQQLLMVEAGQLEADGKYAEAMKKYKDVQEEVRGEKVPFYLRAQVRAWMCVYRQWDQAEAEAKKALEAELPKVVAALEKVLQKGLEEEDKGGAAEAALGLGQIHYQLQDWQKAVDALKPFADRLAGEAGYRCSGKGYLILAQTRVGDCEAASKNFVSLYKDCKECKDEPVVAYAAQAVSDCFYASGDTKRAAIALRAATKHPALEAEMKKPEFLLQLAARFVEGGLNAEADQCIDKARKLTGKENKDLDRQLLILEGKRFAQEKKWDKVIETLDRYVSEYQARGDHEEDPYVRRDLAEAYIAKSQPTLQVKDATEAERAYSAALKIISDRLQADPKLDRTFWGWCYRWLEIKVWLGDRGETSAYGDVVVFVDDYKHKDMGGLKDKFLKLREDAVAKQGGARSKGKR